MPNLDPKIKARIELGDEMDYVLAEYLAAERNYKNGTGSLEDLNEKKRCYEVVSDMFKWRFGR